MVKSERLAVLQVRRATGELVEAPNSEASQFSLAG